MWGLPGNFGSDPYIAAAGGSSYVNSVQHVSITIPTGAASATATISPVGSLAFIMFGGFRTTTATATNVGFARVELTNATTVTAYRQSSSGSDTVNVWCDVVDATSNLVASVQAGSVTMASGVVSDTATIAATNASHTVIHQLGLTSTQASLNLTALETVISLSGTTVTAERQTSSGALTVGYVVIEFQAAALNSAVQNFSKSWTSSSSTATQAITSIDPDKTLLFWGGSYANTSSSESKALQRIALTNGTTVTLSTQTAGSIACLCHFSVVEFAPGVLASAVQRGTTSLSGGSGSGSTSISSITVNKSLLSFLHYNSSQIAANINHVCTAVELDSATTVTTLRQGTAGSVISSWEVAHFN
jgi:hypothetical protein